MAIRTSKASSRRLLWLAVIVLIVLWGAAALMRHLIGSVETAALGDRLWEVTLRADVETVADGAWARAAVPADTDHIRIVGQRLVHPGWRLRFSADHDWGIGRQVLLTATRLDVHGFELGFTAHQFAAPLLKRPSLHEKLSAKARERYLRSSPRLGLEHPALVEEVASLTAAARSNEELRARLFTRVRQLLPKREGIPRAVPEVLASGRAGALERANALVALSRAANIPSRLVTGLVLGQETETALHHWVELYEDGKGWLAYDPLRGYQQALPENYLPFVKDRADLLEVMRATGASTSYGVTNVDEFLDTQAETEPYWQSVFYLTRLPLEMRNVLADLLLLPLAVLLTALFRELTGIRSYGTFMPALFALALVHAEWRMAVVTLVTVLLFGVLGRSALPVGLRRQPRLTLVLILVISGVSASISLMAYLGWWRDGRVVLLPVVITAILVDLFYKAMDKEGAASAMMQLGWTLLQVAICLPVMQFNALGHWLVAHPETHLLTLAATVMVSAYGGRRLADQPRFRWLNWSTGHGAKPGH